MSTELSKETISSSESEYSDSDFESDTRNVDTNYKPPYGYEKETVFINKKSSAFEMSKLKNKELFLIRVPVDIPDSVLDGLTIKIGDNVHENKPLSKITVEGKKKNEENEYGIFQIDATSDKKSRQNSDMAQLSCIIPEHKEKNDDGTLVISNKPFSRFFVVKPMEKLPSTDELKEAGSAIKDTPFQIRKQPEGLSMSFTPYGFNTENEPLVESLSRYEKYNMDGKKVKKDKSSKKEKSEKKDKSEKKSKKDKSKKRNREESDKKSSSKKKKEQK
ncbi:hypothetical protein BCR32DRAFT_325750 [Anaeromyces robustus]|uniref:Uncharacterized protein n=1 Tax=Anaeromyces robustus TaxID=1754192 RepID=A0A1Y1XG43_9FUNG|nr:hypothetical protein BCR32DRAFT_325750 [Anaeromyces robustus]|eukprot:ORX84728.1 hypothetical protein BCR32DRAFT_325750 [Anaeromyces robustus]